MKMLEKMDKMVKRLLIFVGSIVILTILAFTTQNMLFVQHVISILFVGWAGMWVLFIGSDDNKTLNIMFKLYGLIILLAFTDGVINNFISNPIIDTNLSTIFETITVISMIYVGYLAIKEIIKYMKSNKKGDTA